MKGKVKLLSCYLTIPFHVVEKIFGEENTIFVYFAKERNKLMMSPVSSEWFKSLYKAKQLILKLRNMQGDKSLDVKQFLIDNNLSEEDRELDYIGEENSKILTLFF